MRVADIDGTVRLKLQCYSSSADTLEVSPAVEDCLEVKVVNEMTTVAYHYLREEDVRELFGYLGAWLHKHREQ